VTTAPASGRTVTTVEEIPPLGRRRTALALLVALAVGYLGLTVAAGWPAAEAFSLAAFVVAGLELALLRRAAAVEWALARVAAGPELRSLLRGLLLLLLAARATGAAVQVTTAAAVVLLTACHLLRRGLAQVVGHLRTPPVLSRNLPLGAVRLPAAPPGWTTGPRGLLPLVDLPGVVGVGLAAAGAGPAIAYAGLVVTVAVAAVPVSLLAGHALALRRGRIRERLPAEITRRLADLAPEVILYFAGSTTSAYQLEMWLAPVERLGRPAAVLIRDRDVLDSLPATSLPVLCVPHSSTVMALDLPSARVALYVANAAGNIHLLRRRGVWSVFIGHGDSDKGASSSPFSRVYDEIWVAGPAGRDRYLQAGIGVTTERIVEVGRPQLPAAPPSRRHRAVVGTTVLYAPTWEGWGDEEHHTSLGSLGPKLVSALLARADVRVLYRPHPLTGTRDAAVRRAHDSVVALLRAAGGVGLIASGRSAASRSGPDYWAAAPAAHRILTPPAPDLQSCFTEADALVADVSSVTTDFLATDRPYAVVDAGGLGPVEFCGRYPSAAGGVVIGPDLRGLDVLLRAARGEDPTAAARHATRDYLLGPADAAATFRAAVDRLVATPPPHASRSTGSPGSAGSARSRLPSA